MLDKVKITAVEALASLNDDQIAAIETLSRNDEDQVIHDKTREWYNKWDADIEAATGIKRNPTEKTFDYYKRTTQAMKDKLSAVEKTTQELEAQKAKVADLESKIAANSGDDALKTKLRDKDSEINSLREAHKTEVDKLSKMLEEKTTEMTAVINQNRVQKALSEFTFKPEDALDKDIRNTFVEKAINSLFAEATPDTVDGVEVWRDKDGNIIRNPARAGEPMTTAELLAPKLTKVLETGTEFTGAGTGNPKPAEGSPASTKIVAKSQTEFTQKAIDVLRKKGIRTGTKEFTEALTQLRKENDASKLPMQEVE